MSIPPSVARLREELSEQFPQEARAVEERLAGMGLNADYPTSWFEKFAEQTNQALRRRDERAARQHLRFLSRKLSQADAHSREYIDVYYVELLMHGFTAEDKRWSWPLIPENLQALYVSMWSRAAD
jgi:hypothetical protein